MSEIINTSPMTPSIPLEVPMQDSDATLVEIEDLLTPLEEQTVPLHELKRANDRVDEFRGRTLRALASREQLAANVTSMLTEAVASEWISKEHANKILSELDCKKIVSTWTVRVKFGGYEVLVVSGVEAEDENDACDMVRDDVSVSIQSVNIVVEFEYNGDGQVDDSDTYEDDDGDGVEASNYEYGLSFTAEEE